MFTENYMKYREMMFLGTSAIFKDYTGTDRSAHAQYSWAGDIGYSINGARLENEFSSKYSGVYLGTGTTAPQKTDYCLESPIASGLSITYGSRLVGYSDGKGEVSGSFSVKNTSGADITISEMGYFGTVGASASTSYLVLMERTVLDNPITIAPGATKIITYKVTFNHR